MQAAVRQVDLVDRHVDAAQLAFDGVHVAISAAIQEGTQGKRQALGTICTH
jgi:hypothetical protein